MGVTRSNDDLLLEQQSINTKLDTLNTNGAKEAKQDTLITAAGDILAKIIAAPSTEAKQDVIIAALGDLATETTAAAILAKIIAAPSTEAKQDAIITAIGDIGGGNATVGAATSVSQSATSVELLAAESNRVEAIIRNDSSQTLYIEEGSAATTNSAVQLKKDDIYISDNFTGAINGIWSGAGGGSARITEKTTT